MSRLALALSLCCIAVLLIAFLAGGGGSGGSSQRHQSLLRRLKALTQPRRTLAVGTLRTIQVVPGGSVGDYYHSAAYEPFPLFGSSAVAVRGYSSGVTGGSTLFVFGGNAGGASDEGIKDSLWRLDVGRLQGGKFSYPSNAAWQCRSALSMCQNATTVSSTACRDQTAVTISNSTLPTDVNRCKLRRSFHSAIVAARETTNSSGGAMLVFGGRGQDGSTMNDVVELDMNKALYETSSPWPTKSLPAQENTTAGLWQNLSQVAVMSKRYLDINATTSVYRPNATLAAANYSTDGLLRLLLAEGYAAASDADTQLSPLYTAYESSTITSFPDAAAPPVLPAGTQVVGTRPVQGNTVYNYEPRARDQHAAAAMPLRTSFCRTLSVPGEVVVVKTVEINATSSATLQALYKEFILIATVQQLGQVSFELPFGQKISAVGQRVDASRDPLVPQHYYWEQSVGGFFEQRNDLRPIPAFGESNVNNTIDHSVTPAVNGTYRKQPSPTANTVLIVGLDLEGTLTSRSQTTELVRNGVRLVTGTNRTLAGAFPQKDSEFLNVVTSSLVALTVKTEASYKMNIHVDFNTSTGANQMASSGTTSCTDCKLVFNITIKDETMTSTGVTSGLTRMLIFGGQRGAQASAAASTTDSVLLNDLWVFDRERQLDNAVDFVNATAAAACMASTDANFPSGPAFPNVPAVSSWRRIYAGNPPAARFGHALVHVVDGPATPAYDSFSYAVMFGGQGDADFLSDAWVLRLGNTEESVPLSYWAPISPGVAAGTTATPGVTVPSKRQGHAMSVLPGATAGKKQVWVHGGWDGQRILNDVWILELDLATVQAFGLTYDASQGFNASVTATGIAAAWRLVRRATRSQAWSYSSFAPVVFDYSKRASQIADTVQAHGASYAHCSSAPSSSTDCADCSLKAIPDSTYPEVQFPRRYWHAAVPVSVSSATEPDGLLVLGGVSGANDGILRTHMARTLNMDAADSRALGYDAATFMLSFVDVQGKSYLPSCPSL